jgi:hypothetical protein
LEVGYVAEDGMQRRLPLADAADALADLDNAISRVHRRLA